jgi:hypothetical protein
MYTPFEYPLFSLIAYDSVSENVSHMSLSFMTSVLYLASHYFYDEPPFKKSVKLIYNYKCFEHHVYLTSKTIRH